MSAMCCPCHDCGRETAFDGAEQEYYMVTDACWRVATLGDLDVRFLCIGCIEARLGYGLVPSDFIDMPINRPDLAQPMFGPMSARLLNRLGFVRR